MIKRYLTYLGAVVSAILISTLSSVQRVEGDSMKNVLYSILIVLAFGCSNVENIPIGSDTYTVEIVDSLAIPYVGVLKFVDQNLEKERLLFVDVNSIQVIEVDYNGQITNQFQGAGNDEGKIGNRLGAIGYYGLDTVAMVSERGVFLTKMNGEIIDFKKRPIQFVDQTYLNLFPFRKNGEEYLAYIAEPFYNLLEELLMPGDGQYHDRFRLLNVFNLSKEEMTFEISYDENSIFKANPKKAYPTANPIISSNSDYFYWITSPEQKVYTYDYRNDFELKETTSLAPNPKYFKTEVEALSLHELLLYNSNYNSLVIDEERILLSYSRGIEKEEMLSTDISGLNDVNEYVSKNQQEYLSVYENRQKVGTDIQLPFEVFTLICPLGEDQYLAYPHNGRVEAKNKSLFYICKIFPNGN